MEVCMNNLESVLHGWITLVRHVFAVPPNDPKSLCGGKSYPDRRSFRKWRILNEPLPQRGFSVPIQKNEKMNERMNAKCV